MRTVDKIQEVLDSKNIKASKMMRDLGFSSGLFSQWKAGKQEVSLEKIISIANYFDCSVDYLLGRTENPNVNNSGTSISQKYIGGDANASITNETKKSADSISEKFMAIFNNLPFEEQLAVMNVAVEKSKKTHERD